MKKNQCGIMAGVGFSTNERGKTIAGNLSYSMKSALDFGLSLGKYTADAFEPDLNLASGSLIVHLLTNDDDKEFNMPVLPSIGAAYVRLWEDNISGEQYIFTGWLYRNIAASSLVTIQPHVKLSYYHSSTTI